MQNKNNYFEIDDELNFQRNKHTIKIFQAKQNVMLSCKVFKFNDYRQRQQRILVITNFNIYNFKNNTPKRKIPIEKIQAVTLSKLSPQFILHVVQEYDYRYSSFDKYSLLHRRNKILLKIISLYCEIKKKKFPLYISQSISLLNYVNTKHDVKKNIHKQPINQPIVNICKKVVNQQEYRQLMQGQKKQQQQIRRKTITMFIHDQKQKQINLSCFTPIKILGKGAHGKVFLVQKKDTKQLFAMKQILKQNIIKRYIFFIRGQLQYTKTEKMILQHINHPFLVNLAFALQTPTKIYFIMKFMSKNKLLEGGQLYQHLAKQNKFDQKRVKFYVAQISLALGHLHKKDIIYRDIKLENILMDDFGNVSLADFGMAKIIKTGQLAKTFCGTPEYMAPQVINLQGYGRAADWWSLGILTYMQIIRYQMLFSLPPFYHKVRDVMFKLIIQQQLKFSQQVKISNQCKDFLKKVNNSQQILIKNPEQRLGSLNDHKQIMEHSWFSDINWDKLKQKLITPPFKPNVQGDQWINGFDKQFTQQQPILQVQKTKKINKQYMFDL